MHQQNVPICIVLLLQYASVDTEYFDMIWPIQVYIVEIDLTTVLLQFRILLIKRIFLWSIV